MLIYLVFVLPSITFASIILATLLIRTAHPGEFSLLIGLIPILTPKPVLNIINLESLKKLWSE